jgi:hypothetical protein
MTTDADAINVAGAREVYSMLDQLDRHINGQDASGRVLLYQLKERVRLLIVSIDRSTAE